MQALRQLGGGVVIAFISLLLVIGGISLALAESSLSVPPTPSPLPSPTQPSQLFVPTPIATNTIELPTIAVISSPSATMPPVPTFCPPPVGWMQIIVGVNDTLYTLAEKHKTTPETLSAANCLTTFEPSVGSLVYVPPIPTVTVVPCGPPAGWVRTHIVQPGDNLFRIALSYGTTVQQLQRANCMGTSTIIYAGQRLWTPNVPTRTPGITITATSTTTPTSTQIPSATSTFISMATEPTATFISTATITPTPTTPVPPP